MSNQWGPDVSSYQGAVDWVAVKAAGAGFGWCKASEGTSWFDPTFVANWQGMGAAGLVRGAYHFFHPSNDPAAEADHFLNVAAAARPGDRVALDYETAPYVRAKATVWLERVHHALPGCEMWVYAPDSEMGAFEDIVLADGTRVLVWVACYGTAPKHRWDMWQSTDRAAVPGVQGACDRSVLAATQPTPTPEASMAQHQGVALLNRPQNDGYWVATAAGEVFSFGAAVYHGAPNQQGPVAHPIVGGQVTASGDGYYLLGEDGGVFCFGDAAYHGSLPELEAAGQA